MNKSSSDTHYWGQIFSQFKQHTIGFTAACLFVIFSLLAVYAPFFASSKPLLVIYDGNIYFPLFRYLFYQGFYTKNLDLFYNLFMFTLPLYFLLKIFMRSSFYRLFICILVQVVVFIYLISVERLDPQGDPLLNIKRQNDIQIELEKYRTSLIYLPQHVESPWKDKLFYLNDYARLNKVLSYYLDKKQHQVLELYSKGYKQQKLESWLKTQTKETKIPRSKLIEDMDPATLHSLQTIPSTYELKRTTYFSKIDQLKDRYKQYEPFYHKHVTRVENLYKEYSILENQSGNKNRLEKLRQELGEYKVNFYHYFESKKILLAMQEEQVWLKTQSKKINFILMPLFRPYHWEDDVGGTEELNTFLPWWQLSRVNHKDLSSSILFGIRASLIVGLLATLLQLLIGIPVGALAGYYGKKIDMIVSRLLEIWEGIPTFFILLLVVAVLQTKSIFVVMIILGVFGWTGISRFIRAEIFKQKELSYVEACRGLGYSDKRIIFGHILPNALPPVVTLLPFAIMGAMTQEAGLSFLGLGEEGGCSCGVLMDEGRQAFPGESYLLWPPALVLTILLVLIALVGDALIDTMDPRRRR